MIMRRSERHHFMQLPSGHGGSGGSDFKRGVVQSWLPEATKLDAGWQLGGHWQPSNTRQNRPKVQACNTAWFYRFYLVGPYQVLALMMPQPSIKQQSTYGSHVTGAQPILTNDRPAARHLLSLGA